MDNRKIVEALQLQPLSEEEKTSRHILGRLYGPIATSKESTRNGRKYNAELWDRQLNDEIFNEKIATKALLLELGHPLDREETDMSKVCACIPQLPKTIDGDLYATVDILDTPNGRILKTLCDYGFIPGISSRGSGDVMSNNEVDPETFFLETWDIVQIPAVKKARLSMYEGLDEKSAKLRHALTESYNNSSEEDKEIMKETLDNLDIKLEDVNAPALDPAPAEFANPEDLNNEITEAKKDDDEADVKDEPKEDTAKDDKKDDKKEDEESFEPKNEFTVKEITDAFKGLDKDAVVKVLPVEINNEEMNINLYFDKTDEDNLVIGGTIAPVEDNENIDADNSIDGVNPEADAAAEEAVDNGADETVESFKNLVRQNGLLESELKSLRNEKTVSDAKVKELTEELEKYKEGFARVGELAAQAKTFKAQAEKLTEQVSQKSNQITELEKQVAETKKLNEGVNKDSAKIKLLTEKVDAISAENTSLTETLDSYKKKCNERTELVKKYKTKFLEGVKHYINSKASMLGVRATDIANRLNEDYSFENIDKVCEQIIQQNVGRNTLPFSQNVKVKINESKNIKSTKSVNTTPNPDEGYDIDDSLWELAGIKPF